MIFRLVCFQRHDSRKCCGIMMDPSRPPLMGGGGGSGIPCTGEMILIRCFQGVMTAA